MFKKVTFTSEDLPKQPVSPGDIVSLRKGSVFIVMTINGRNECRCIRLSGEATLGEEFWLSRDVLEKIPSGKIVIEWSALA